jgi:hypothetical protein
MLQFLQYKIFGRHTVPKGWIVVTAGNPPEYNNSVREFDIVTWDRLKRIDVEANYDVWKEYAINSGVHASITTYLDIKKGDFYKVETTVDGKSFVTARGWSDLSDMIKLYEKNNIKVDGKLVSQYLQDRKIAKDFAIYYDLYNKYKSDYQIVDILEGKDVDDIISRAQAAKFDERIALIGLLLDAIYASTSETYCMEASLRLLTTELRNLKSMLMHDSVDNTFDTIIKNVNGVLGKGKHASSMSRDDIYAYNSLLNMLDEIRKTVVTASPSKADDAFKLVKKQFDGKVKALKAMSVSVGDKLSNAFKFLEIAFGDGQEMLIFVTELTLNRYTASFISRYGSTEYFRHNKDLLLYERHKDIIREIEILNIED